MIYKYLFIILFITSCDRITESKSKIEEPTKEELHKEYILNLHYKNTEEVYKNQNFVNILSVKHNIPDSICVDIITDYLNLINNEARNYTNQYKIETIKNYAFENDLSEKQVANLLHDYLSYKESTKN
ncbi:hypothetical protein H1R17_10995 [Flavobacterium sp. xlx-214]|uniref:hypothetical protein n=1 Tax=unclassified Flavobacterium TaxID=196869 RepID=UPI0013D47043|nr:MULTISPECIES: hypothetical protein [unclassified Flavobacterium]MBA5791740.1 hypothetical protein [Flavobacterium sp. xlx-221]QMI82979.1 hypothetical protein H1R17_10995 [Flavobacterium sp. xlx-214]